MSITGEYQFPIFFFLLIYQSLKSDVSSFDYILFKFSNFLLTHDVQVYCK